MARSKKQEPTLTWPGKKREDLRDVLPLTLHSLWGDAARGSWRDLLIHADNLPLLSSLTYGPLREYIEEAGGLKLVYIDPPFAVGADFTAKPGGVGALAYRDIWEGGMSAFLSMLYPRLLLIRELLAKDGSLYLHCDYRTAAYMRLLLDEIFGPGRYLGSIVWHYTGGGRARRWFSRKHDTIFHFARSHSWHFNPDAVRVPYKPTSGYAKAGIVSAAGKRYLPHPDGTPVDDVWDIPMVNPLAAERTGYPTQKPEALLERILLASSRPGDLAADFFCGSGTTAAVARRLGRRCICVDSSALAIQAAQRRLVTLPESAAPFAVATLGAAGSREETKEPLSFRHRAELVEGEIRYTVSHIRISVARAGEGAHFTLQDMRVVVEDCPPSATLPGGGAKFLPRDWADWLDSWSVGLACGGPDDRDITDWDAPPGMVAGPGCNRMLWHGARSANGPPALCATVLAPPAAARYGSSWGDYIVTIVDIFANICRVRVSGCKGPSPIRDTEKTA